MTKQELQNFARNAQAKPFMIHLADGRSLPVAHPEFIAFPREADRFIYFPEEGGLEWVALDQIVSLGQLPSKASGTAS